MTVYRLTEPEECVINIHYELDRVYDHQRDTRASGKSVEDCLDRIPCGGKTSMNVGGCQWAGVPDCTERALPCVIPSMLSD